MAGFHRNLQFGPDTAVVSAAVVGGQLVEADPSNIGFVRPASAGSTTFLGVAAGDAQPSGSNPTNPLNVAWAHPEVAVQYGPADVDMVFTNACAYGQLVVAGANGTVTAAGATPAAGTVVGRCTSPAGVASAGTGRVRLFG